MALFIVAICLCFKFTHLCTTALQLPGVEKLRLHEHACRVIVKRGMNPQSPIFLLRGVHRLIDCVSACSRQADCLSGSYVKDHIFRRSLCLLAKDKAPRDGVLPKVLDAVYFEFECLNEKIATPRGLINHGRMTSLCGRPTDFKSKLRIYKKKRAFDGYQAQPYSVPWLGQVIRGSHNICGVTLISDESMSDGSTIWAVSAAHCFTTRKVGDTFRVDTGAFIFMFGAYDLRYPTPHIVVRNAQNIIIHPEYDFVINNIALIKFDRKILSNDFVRPICLPLTKIATMALENCVYCGYSIALDVSDPPVPSCIPRDFILGDNQQIDLDLRRISSSKIHTGSSNSDSGGLFECTYKSLHKILYVPSVSGLMSLGQSGASNSHNSWIDEVINAVKTTSAPTNVKRPPERKTGLRLCWGSFAKSCSVLSVRPTG